MVTQQIFQSQLMSDQVHLHWTVVENFQCLILEKCLAGPHGAQGNEGH